MKRPGPDHPIALVKEPRRLRVIFNGRTAADTTHALSLREAAYPAVVYVPRADADMRWFERSSRRTHCPYKGEASYFSLIVDGSKAEDAVWSYEDPYPDMADIKGHLAFYPQHVTFDYEEV